MEVYRIHRFIFTINAIYFVQVNGIVLFSTSLLIGHTS